MMNFIMVFSLCPLAQSALEIRFDNLFLVDILPVVECSDLECNFSVVGNPLGNVDCIPGTQVPRGFYLVEFKPNCSPILESEKDAKIALRDLAPRVGVPVLHTFWGAFVDLLKIL